MVRITMMFIFLIACSTKPSLVGNWVGEIDTERGLLDITIKVTKNNNGIYIIKIDNPKMNQYDLETSEVSFEEKILQLKIPAIGAHYIGELTEDGKKLNGLVTMPDGSELVLDAKINGSN